MSEERSLITTDTNLWTTFKQKVLGHNCTYIDFLGRQGTLKYPPKRYYPENLTDKVVALTINGVEKIDDKTTLVDDLRYFKNLTKLTLGDGVKSMSFNSLPSTVEELRLPASLTDIKKDSLSCLSLKKVLGPDYSIVVEDYARKKSIYFDEFGRFNFEVSVSESNASIDPKANHAHMSAEEYTAKNRNVLTDNILNSSTKLPNAQTIYVYAPTIRSDKDYSAHIVLDTFPMPEERKTLPDDQLIGIYVTGKDNLDTSELANYPNLQKVYLGQDIKKVTGIKDSLDEKKDVNGHSILNEQTPTGKAQKIIFLSRDTLPVKDITHVEPHVSEYTKSEETKSSDEPEIEV